MIDWKTTYARISFKQPAYSACGPFTAHRGRIQKFRETGHLKHLYRNELDKACFAHDASYSESKDLDRTISDKVLKDKAYEIARICGYDRYQWTLASMVCKFYDKKTRSGARATSKAEISVNQQLAAEH